MTAEHVVARLHEANVSGLGWSVIEGGLSDKIEGPQVAVMDTAGFPPIAAHGTRGPLRAGVQVLVRGAPRAYEAARSKAVAVWGALHRESFGPVMSCEGRNNPVWLGYGEEQRPMWSLNFVAFLKHP